MEGLLLILKRNYGKMAHKIFHNFKVSVTVLDNSEKKAEGGAQNNFILQLHFFY